VDANDEGPSRPTAAGARSASGPAPVVATASDERVGTREVDDEQAARREALRALAAMIGREVFY